MRPNRLQSVAISGTHLLSLATVEFMAALQFELTDAVAEWSKDDTILGGTHASNVFGDRWICACLRKAMFTASAMSYFKPCAQPGSVYVSIQKRNWKFVKLQRSGRGLMRG
eukprot:2543226-Amphidinium_carterae.1